MNQLLCIALGGSLGALTRFFVANSIYAWLGRAFPYGTLFVNVSGCLAMGLLSELLTQRFPQTTEYRSLLMIGFLGAYTTFSSFALETLFLVEQDSPMKAGVYVVLSNLLCLGAVWFGLTVGRSLFSDATTDWGDQLGLLGQAVLAAAMAFVAAALVGWCCQRGGLPAPTRAAVMVGLLGVATVAATLWGARQLSGNASGLLGAFGLFAGNASLGMVIVWAGATIGERLAGWTLPIDQ